MVRVLIGWKTPHVLHQTGEPETHCRFKRPPALSLLSSTSIPDLILWSEQRGNIACGNLGNAFIAGSDSQTELAGPVVMMPSTHFTS